MHRPLILLLLIFVPAAFAQEQERKLADRLMQPDMKLQNSSQKKKFIADGASIDKKASTGNFNWEEKNRPKSFSGSKTFSAKNYGVTSFYNNRDTPVSSATAVHKANVAFATHTAPGVRVASNSTKKAESRDFAGNRPFLGEGKSQKALSQKSRPLTIDEVRELLNKNK